MRRKCTGKHYLEIIECGKPEAPFVSIKCDVCCVRVIAGEKLSRCRRCPVMTCVHCSCSGSMAAAVASGTDVSTNKIQSPAHDAGRQRKGASIGDALLASWRSCLGTAINPAIESSRIEMMLHNLRLQGYMCDVAYAVSLLRELESSITTPDPLHSYGLLATLSVPPGGLHPPQPPNQHRVRALLSQIRRRQHPGSPGAPCSCEAAFVASRARLKMAQCRE